MCYIFAIHDLEDKVFFSVVGEENSEGMSGQFLKDMTACWQVMPKEAVQGNMVHSCYRPLSRTQTEWQISINDVTKHVAKEQAKIMQARLLLPNQMLIHYQ